VTASQPPTPAMTTVFMPDNTSTQTRVATVLQCMSEMVNKGARYAGVCAGCGRQTIYPK